MLASKTYEIITPESALHGDFEESGFEFENVEITTDQAVEMVQETLGYFEGVGSFPTIYGTDAEQDLDGTVTAYALHFEGTEFELARLKALLEKSTYNSCPTTARGLA